MQSIISIVTVKNKTQFIDEGDVLTKRRVVITGLGMVSPLGLNVEDTWRGILAGKNGITQVDKIDTTDYFCKIAATVKDFDPSPYMSAKEARKVDDFIQFGVAAASQAVVDAGIDKEVEDGHRIGVAIGSGIGGLALIEKSQLQYLAVGPRKVSPFFIPGVIINLAAGHLSIKYGFKGPSISIVTACTTGVHNIGYAARTIAYGDADVMVAGGTEMATCALGLSGFGAMRALSTRNDEPEKACRPWDKDRDGFILGEGAGVMVLEEYERAKKRGAKIYAELAGFGMSSDAHHITSPNMEGPTSAMENALRDAKLNPAEVDYLNAHGTSTPVGDINECRAIKRAFGDHAYRLAVSSTKSMIGHLLGAAGAVESIFSILALRDNVAPPTRNLDNPDEECDLNFVPHTAQERQINVSLNNSFGFGGTNATLVFKKIT
ncbi:MAG: fabF [Gammaproteobacteria bacterium]|nr:fabF [Gammaproteobacteria bacterium]